MVSVCATCKGLQLHLSPYDSNQESDELGVVQWVNTTLSALRRSAGGCRACALILQGILLHHDRYQGVKEDRLRIIAQTYRSSSTEKAQEHLSVDLRWKEQPGESCGDTTHDHEDGYPDLKLEYFLEEGM
jgi:hypothetical protein